MRRLGPYAVALIGVVAITFAIALLASSVSVPGLSAVYLVLVLWIAARWGRGPAVTGSIAAFLLYDYFIVPPVGTFPVHGPTAVFELLVLLVVALATSPPPASTRRARAMLETRASGPLVPLAPSTAAHAARPRAQFAGRRNIWNDGAGLPV